MKKIAPIRPLTTIFSYVFVGVVALLVLFPALLLLAILPEKQRRSNTVIFWSLDLFYRSVIFSLRTPILYEKNGAGNGGNGGNGGPVIWIANHQSSIDIPLLGALVKGRPHIWYALAYYARKPILGFFIKRIGFALDRDSASGSAHGLLRGLRALSKNPCDVMIFPEGARFNDGNVHEFLHGFVVIARKTKLPVVPVYMPFNGRVYPPEAFWLRRHHLVVFVGPSFELLSDETDEAFVARVRGWFLEKQALINV